MQLRVILRADAQRLLALAPILRAGNQRLQALGPILAALLFTSACAAAPNLPARQLPQIDRNQGNGEPCLPDVETAVAALPTRGSELAFWSGEVGDQGALIPWPRYAFAPVNDFGLGNHFQGVRRLAGSRYLIVTGADTNDRAAHLFVVRMASRPDQGSWGTNLHRASHPNYGWLQIQRPEADDRVMARVDLDNQLWHAGGHDTLGALVAIPLTDGADSRIVFYDLRDPLHPEQLPASIERPASKAYAVSLAKVADGRTLIAIVTDTSIDFGISQSDQLADGFDVDTFASWGLDLPETEREAVDDAQNIDLLRQCDGELFLLLFRNTSSLSPVIPGKDLARLYRVTFAPGDAPNAPSLELRSRLEFACGTCNFDAASGAYVSGGQQLALYGMQHFRHPLAAIDLIRDGPTVVGLSEFWPDVGD